MLDHDIDCNKNASIMLSKFGEAKSRKNGGEQFQHVSGVLYGKKELENFWRKGVYNTEDSNGM